MRLVEIDGRHVEVTRYRVDGKPSQRCARDDDLWPCDAAYLIQALKGLPAALHEKFCMENDGFCNDGDDDRDAVDLLDLLEYFISATPDSTGAREP